MLHCVNQIYNLSVDKSTDNEASLPGSLSLPQVKCCYFNNPTNAID